MFDIMEEKRMRAFLSSILRKSLMCAGFLKECASIWRGKDGGQLVLLGFDVTALTPAAYQRHRL